MDENVLSEDDIRELQMTQVLCDANNITDDYDKVAVYNWIHQACVDNMLMNLALDGLIDIVGVDEKDGPIFKTSEKGLQKLTKNNDFVPSNKIWGEIEEIINSKEQK